jgi:hypothetical protein
LCCVPPPRVLRHVRHVAADGAGECVHAFARTGAKTGSSLAALLADSDDEEVRVFARPHARRLLPRTRAEHRAHTRACLLPADWRRVPIDTPSTASRGTLAVEGLAQGEHLP